MFEPLVHCFGPSGAPNQFCRGSFALLEIANFWLAVCAVVHMDDTVIIDTYDEIDNAREVFLELAEILNCVQKPSKAIPPRDA